MSSQSSSPSQGQASAIAILRPGEFTSASGVKVRFTRADLAELAENYDPADPAPLVIGHPRDNHPAFGWVAGLRLDGDRLMAIPKDVVPEFAQSVRERRYAKVSASIFPPHHPANPRPGKMSLRHVGFLGGAAPAVKGLGMANLNAGDDGLLTINFSEPSEEQKDIEMPKPNTDKAAASGSNSETIDLAERISALDAREAELKAKEAAMARAAADARHQDALDFAEQLVSEARLAPAGKALLVGVMDALGAPDAAPIDLAEGEKVSPVAALKKLLSGAQPLVELGEKGAKPKGAADAAPINFAAPAGYDVDPESARLYASAKALQAANSDLGWIDAVKQAQAQG